MAIGGVRVAGVEKWQRKGNKKRIEVSDGP